MSDAKAGASAAEPPAGQGKARALLVSSYVLAAFAWRGYALGDAFAFAFAWRGYALGDRREQATATIRLSAHWGPRRCLGPLLTLGVWTDTTHVRARVALVAQKVYLT
jgi:hypothetical protein